MPELPEIEHLKRSLEPLLVGAKVIDVRLSRRDIVHVGGTTESARLSGPSLLRNATIEGLRRHGKQLAIVSDRGGVVCVHLGMTGQLLYVPEGGRTARAHVHCRWWLGRGATGGRLVFRDPRRFGGLWLYASTADLSEHRWCRLGPDALSIAGPDLCRVLAGRSRPIKSSLLDQSILAGVGNIYADEALFAARVNPRTRTSSLTRSTVIRLAREVRRTMKAAIDAGGSTLRDYRDAEGRPGTYVGSHRVYGRAGRPCLECGETLRRLLVAQRTTTFCPQCQGGS